MWPLFLRVLRKDTEPEDSWSNMGWVLIALQNAFCRLRRGEKVEAALVATVGKGGDTDTNGAIVGALLGAADGLRAIPQPLDHAGPGLPTPSAPSVPIGRGRCAIGPMIWLRSRRLF